MTHGEYDRFWSLWWNRTYCWHVVTKFHPLFKPLKDHTWSLADPPPHYNKLKEVSKKCFDLGRDSYGGSDDLTSFQKEISDVEEEIVKLFCDVFYQAGQDFLALSCEHEHCCRKCFHIWRHNPRLLKDTDYARKKAHTCAKCKTVEFDKFHKFLT